jgi:hypothetical protein
LAIITIHYLHPRTIGAYFAKGFPISVHFPQVMDDPSMGLDSIRIHAKFSCKLEDNQLEQTKTKIEALAGAGVPTM